MLDPHLPLFFALFALAITVTGAAACDGLAEGPAGTVTAVHDGNTLVLDSGIAVRLIGTLAPLPAGQRAPAEPLAAAARAALAGLVLHQPVHLGLDEEETDRYGRMEAQVFLDDPQNTWVEQALLARGMARLAPEGPNLRCLAELLPTEAKARAAGVGIWADPYYSVRDAGDPAALEGRAGRYELIEGEVVTTGELRDRLYLDFGRVWKNDVTATIEGKAKALFAAAGIDPLALRGKRVRIRGWLTSRDGPAMALGSPEQIEVLDRQ